MPHQQDGMNQEEEEPGVQEMSLGMSSDDDGYTAGPGTSTTEQLQDAALQGDVLRKNNDPAGSQNKFDR